MKYKVAVKEHQAFITARIQDKAAIAKYNNFLIGSAIASERRHCIGVGHHYTKLLNNVCYFCGGDK